MCETAMYFLSVDLVLLISSTPVEHRELLKCTVK